MHPEDVPSCLGYLKNWRLDDRPSSRCSLYTKCQITVRPSKGAVPSENDHVPTRRSTSPSVLRCQICDVRSSLKRGSTSHTAASLPINIYRSVRSSVGRQLPVHRLKFPSVCVSASSTILHFSTSLVDWRSQFVDSPTLPYHCILSPQYSAASPLFPWSIASSIESNK